MTITAIHIEGNLIASDMTPEISAGEIKGQTSVDFGLEKSAKLEDEIAFAWGEAKDQWRIFQRRLERIGETDTATSETREYWVIPLLKLLGYDPVYQAKAELIDGQTFAISHRSNPDYKPIFAININQDNSLSPLELIENTQSETQNQDIHPSPPIHIIGCRLSLEQRPPSGMPRISAHGLLQEYLNKTEHLWGIVTNGLRWRLLRDCSLMTRLTYVEFNLEQILNGENFAEFSLFYRLFHRSRLPETVEDVDSCLLEFYHQEALQQGGRVRDRLRDGVEQALLLLGCGFLQHPSNEKLRQKIRSCTLAPGSGAEAQQLTFTEGEFYRQLLLLIYRLLFLMVAESRNLLLAGEDEEKARIYNEYYSVSRLRIFAESPSYRREGFQDIWQGLRVTFSLFDESWRGELLRLSPLNGDLFGSRTLEILDNCAIDNHDLLLAIRHLSLYENKGMLRRVNYTALDVEELGSVYESLLDFTPRVAVRDGIYYFRLVAGSDRKTTGSYYTPPELVGQLIKSALEPVIEAKVRSCALAPKSGARALQQALEEALLSLKVCDPACGSGHFLLAAARRIAKELARIRTGEVQPTPEALRIAIRDVIQHCIYGVDLNPLAVDLCKVALWIEGFYKGMPLNFLDHRIKCGNSLVGVMDLEVLKEGIPDNAYKAVTGDEKSLAASLKKRNKKEREKKGQLSLFDIELGQRQSDYAVSAAVVDEIADNTTAGYQQKRRKYEELRRNSQWWQDFSACNLWTAAFFMPLTEHNLQSLPTTEALNRLLKEAAKREELESQQGSLFALGETSKSTPFGVVQIVEAANKLAAKHYFFHWCLEFPEVFEKGGFDCVLGNPPWEKIKIQEKEFFITRDLEIAESSNRKSLIKNLPQTNLVLAKEWENAQHDSDAQSKFIRESGRFPLTSKGDINTYTIFTETNWQIINSIGRVGCIVPPGIATDDSTKIFIQELVDTNALISFYDFTNRGYIFKALESTHSFSLLTLARFNADKINLAAQLWKLEDLKKTERVYSLNLEDIKLINPNTANLPIFRTPYDAEFIYKIYTKIPVFENQIKKENLWKMKFGAMFHMTNDKEDCFKKSKQLEDEKFILSGNLFIKGIKVYVPLYESKLTNIYNHRASTFNGIPESKMFGTKPKTNELDLEQLKNPDQVILPRYWVEEQEVNNRIPDFWKYKWFIGFRNAISAVADSRSVRFTIIPKYGVGNSMPLIFSEETPKKLCCLAANFNSLVLDYIAKQKASGGNLNFYVVKQLPIIPPDWYTEEDIEYISSRVLELVYTAYDMKPFAEDMGYDGEPFIWDEQRRAILRAELDAKYAKLYGLTRDELRYILDPADIYGEDFPSETFRVLKNNEMKKYGEYRTQRLVLAAWDMMGY